MRTGNAGRCWRRQSERRLVEEVRLNIAYRWFCGLELNDTIPEGVSLTYHRLTCNQSTGKDLRCCQVDGNACKDCSKRPTCFHRMGMRRRILASSCYPAFYRGHQRVGTPEFLSMMRLRKIWAEGSFSVLKRKHCIAKIRKRGILAATEECLLAAMA